MAGKGSKPRPVDKEKYDRNYENIFRKNKPQKVLITSEGEVIPVDRALVEMLKIGSKYIAKEPTVEEIMTTAFEKLEGQEKGFEE